MEAAVRVGPGEAEGAGLAGGALHSLHAGLAGAVALGVAPAVAILVALVLQGARGVAVARPAERETEQNTGKGELAKPFLSFSNEGTFVGLTLSKTPESRKWCSPN